MAIGTQSGSIEITIDRSGAVYFKVTGVKGTGCMDLTEALEKALGIVASRERTAEYYEVSLSQATGQTLETVRRPSK